MSRCTRGPCTPNSPEKHGPGQVNCLVSCAGQVICPGDILVPEMPMASW